MATDVGGTDRDYGAPVRERDESRHLAAGAGAHADPDAVADETGPAVTDVTLSGAADVTTAPSGVVTAATPESDVVQAVVKFVEDLVEAGHIGDGESGDGESRDTATMSSGDGTDAGG